MTPWSLFWNLWWFTTDKQGQKTAQVWHFQILDLHCPLQVRTSATRKCEHVRKTISARQCQWKTLLAALRCNIWLFAESSDNILKQNTWTNVLSCQKVLWSTDWTGCQFYIIMAVFSETDLLWKIQVTEMLTKSFLPQCLRGLTSQWSCGWITVKWGNNTCYLFITFSYSSPIKSWLIYSQLQVRENIIVRNYRLKLTKTSAST